MPRRSSTAENLTEENQNHEPVSTTALAIIPKPKKRMMRGRRGKRLMRAQQAPAAERPKVEVGDPSQLERWDLLPWGACSKIVSELGPVRAAMPKTLTLRAQVNDLMRDIAAFGRQLDSAGGVLDNQEAAQKYLARAGARVMAMLEVAF